jgi:HTH-type transcriptional regulator/antitoxin HigA
MRSKTYERGELKLGKVFPPGHFIRTELQARKWTQRKFARILGRPPQFVSELLNGKRSITPQAAVELSAALGPSPTLFLNLQQTWDLSKVKPADPAIARRARAA